jgi:tellurite resistance protein TerB
MPTLEQRRIVEAIAAHGKVESKELDVLRHALYTNGKLSRGGADLLVELFKRVERRSPAFEQFYYRAVKDHILADGRIGAEETAWLRQMLFADERIDNEERKFLRQLKGEFEHLFAECMKQPLEQHTSG